MITIQEDGEFTHTIADAIEKLSAMNEFIVKIWVSSELPFKFDETSDIHFLTESIRVISREGRISYIALDSVLAISIYPSHLKEFVA